MEQDYLEESEEGIGGGGGGSVGGRREGAMGHKGREKRTKVAGKPKKNDKYRGDRQTDRQIDRQRQTETETERQTDRHIQADRQTGAEREREGEGQRVGRDGVGGCRKGLIEEEGSKQ